MPATTSRPMQSTMKNFVLYDFLNRLPWPKRFAHKLLLTAFIGTHVPLILLILYISASADGLQHINWVEFGVVLGGTLLGTAITLLAIQALLKPVSMIESQMKNFVSDRKTPTLPVHYRDELGNLMRHTQYSLMSLNQTLQHLEQCAMIDPLTNVFNREAAQQRLQQRCEQDDADKSLLMFIDLDKFKQINDEYGHNTGDEVLKTVSRVLRTELRQNDWVARWGGDEFLVLLENSESTELDKLVVRLQQHLKNVTLAEGLKLDIPLSIGVARLQSQITPQALVDKADAAMYRAKRDITLTWAMAS